MLASRWFFVQRFSRPPTRDKLTHTGAPVLSLSEALFVAKEFGIISAKEAELSRTRSLDNTTLRSPFTVSNFLEKAKIVSRSSAANNSTTIDSPTQKASSSSTGSSSSAGSLKSDSANNGKSSSEPSLTIHNLIKTHLASETSPSKFSGADNRYGTFELNGHTYAWQAEGMGTRKRATAHVILRRGSGLIKLNGEEDFFQRFRDVAHKVEVLMPLFITGLCGHYDAFVHVKGGGVGGQAGAVRTAIARAVLAANPKHHGVLSYHGALFEDTRQKLSKMAGRRGAFARPSWTLRRPH